VLYTQTNLIAARRREVPLVRFPRIGLKSAESISLPTLAPSVTEMQIDSPALHRGILGEGVPASVASRRKHGRKHLMDFTLPRRRLNHNGHFEHREFRIIAHAIVIGAPHRRCGHASLTLWKGPILKFYPRRHLLSLRRPFGCLSLPPLLFLVM
jgi:hypothetical protein